jgi:uncharacterized protein YndB with AHSA1/START domain
MPESAKIKKQQLVVTRIIDAPVELVWKAWTETEQVRHWWGPQFYTSPSCEIELRVGGKYIFAMQAPEDQGGQISYTTGTYLRIVPMQLLEFTQSLSDAHGNRIDPQQAGMPPEFPSEVHMLVSFKAIGEMTELTITEDGWTMSQMYVYSYAGMQQQIDKLALYVGRNR